MPQYTVKGGAKGKARRTARKKAQNAAFNTITGVSQSEQITRDLLADSMVGWVRRMKSALHRPNSGQLREIFNQLGSNVDLTISDQEVKDDNIVHDQMMKIMLLSTLQSMIEAETNRNHPLIIHIEEYLRKNTIRTSGNKQLPRGYANLPLGHTSDPDILLGYLRPRLGYQYQENRSSGGMSKKGLLASTALVGTASALASGVVAQPSSLIIPDMHYPSGTIPTYLTIQPNQVSTYNIDPSTTFSGTTLVGKQNTTNRTTITGFNQHAANILQRQNITFGTYPITPLQKRYLALGDGMYQWTGLNVYSPFRDFEPLVSNIMKQKFGFIRQQMELLKTKLASHSPERFGSLQYNSIINILQMIRVGDTTLVNEFPQSKLMGRIKVELPADIKDYMTRIANYDRQIEDIYIYVQRRPPTATEKVKSFFGSESNYIIEKIIIMFNVNTLSATNSFYMSFNPIQIDSDFKPFAARFVMPHVGNIKQVIEAIDNVLKLEASYIGFWHPTTPTAAIIANLKATNSITKDIIADMGKFSEIAFALTKLRMGDFLINGLSQVVNDPSTSLEMRLRSYQLQDSIYTLASSEQEWNVQTVDQLVDLATRVAVSGGRLDDTLRDDQVVIQFIKDTTYKFGGALRDSINAVAGTAEFFGGSLNRLIDSANKLSKDIIRREIMFMYITFFVYYLTMGSCTMKLLSWAAPLLNPVGPVIALESVVESISGIQPSSITAILMLYLFYRIWDKEKVAPITGTIMELFQMFRCSKVGIPISAASSPPVSNNNSAKTLASLSNSPVASAPSSSPTASSSARRKRAFGPAMTPRATLSSSKLSAAAALYALPNSGTSRLRSIGENGAIVPPHVHYSSAISKKELNARNAKIAAEKAKIAAEKARLGQGGGYTRKRKHNTKRTRRHRR